MSAAVATRPAVALVVSYELLMVIIHSAQGPGTRTALRGVPEYMPDANPLSAQAAQAFAGELAAGRVPSVRAIHASACAAAACQRVRAYMAALNSTQAGVSLEHPAAIPGVPSAA
jgi:hypothetical protein